MVDLGLLAVTRSLNDVPKEQYSWHDAAYIANRKHGEMYFVVLDNEQITALVDCPRCRLPHYAYITDLYVVDANTGYRPIEGQKFPMGRARCAERECQHCGKTWSQYENMGGRRRG